MRTENDNIDTENNAPDVKINAQKVPIRTIVNNNRRGGAHS